MAKSLNPDETAHEPSHQDYTFCKKKKKKLFWSIGLIESIAVLLLSMVSGHVISNFIINHYFLHWRYSSTKQQKITTKTCLYNFDPLKPHFYIVKLGFTGVYIFFLFLLKNIDCGYSLEPPRRGGSNEYPQSMF